MVVDRHIPNHGHLFWDTHKGVIDCRTLWLCDNQADVVPVWMMFKLSFCFSVPTSLSPSVTPSWWFQVWVYWCFTTSDLLSHTLNTDTHNASNNTHTRAQCYTLKCESGVCTQPQTCKCWLHCHSAPQSPLPFNGTQTHTGYWWRTLCGKFGFRNKIRMNDSFIGN